MKINNNEIKAIVFDMDGVLIDTEKYITRYWCMAAREYGFPMELSHAYMIRSLQKDDASKKLKEIFGEDFNFEAIRNRRRELVNEHFEKYGIEPKPYVKETACKLKDAGYKLAVATSTDIIRTEQYLRKTDIFNLFDEIICSNMVDNGKPMPDIYLYACKKMGFEPKECIAVEDSTNGIISAYRANMNVIMIPDLTKETENERSMTFKIVKNLKELGDILY